MNDWIKKVNDYSRDSKIIKFQMSKESWKEHWYKTIPQKIKDSGVIESNSLIARFMGYSIDDKNEFFHGIHYYYLTEDTKSYDELTIDNVRGGTEGFVWNYTSLTERRYDNSWDILMPVIEKIENLENHMVKIERHNHPNKKFICTIIYSDDSRKLISEESTTSKIEAVYKSVVKFVNAYNKLKK